MFENVPLGAANAARFDRTGVGEPMPHPEVARAGSSHHAAGLYWLTAALAEIDYGVLLLDEDGRVVHANPVALAETRGDHPLQLAGDRLRVHDPRDASVFLAAVDGASRRGLRKLVSLRMANGEPVSLSVVPLVGLAETPPATSVEWRPRQPVLVMLGKRRIGSELAIESFARLHGLSAGETRVLLALTAGLQPTELAQRHGVAIATVRTQIGSIRAKTGAASIRSLLRQVTTLPPLQGILHRDTGCGPSHTLSDARIVRLPG